MMVLQMLPRNAADPTRRPKGVVGHCGLGFAHSGACSIDARRAVFAGVHRGGCKIAAHAAPLSNPWNNGPRGNSNGINENQMKTIPEAVPQNV
jgi:hypothetical protein